MRQYFNGARARLNYLKGQHGDNWRTFVKYHVNPEGIAQGSNSGELVWYSFNPVFRDEKFADDIVRLDHTGWYGDTENAEKLHRGIVAALPHGKYLAGYYQDDNGERVYYPRLFTDADEAARIADEHARIAAENEDEYSQRFNRAVEIDGLIEDKGYDVQKSFALRNHPTLGPKERDWTREIIEDIRALRDERKALKVD